ncbi:MAG: molybdopterin-dependent oxidoreductase [Candidatus Caldarchaeum sp.]
MVTITKLPTYCYQCVCGPDLLKVVVKDGVPVGVEPNFDFADKHPAGGRVCVKAYGLVQKMYNPRRVKQPMVRGNKRKGLGEEPRWTPVSWEEALDLVADKLLDIRRKGLVDGAGYPRLAVTLGGAGTPQAYFGTLNAFFAAWGPIDFSLGSGQGVKCYHTEHLFGEYWHRAFIVAHDTPYTRLVISFGHNDNAAGGVTGVWRNAEARAAGMKWVQVEPHLSVTGATADEWVPIKPKTDAAFLYAMLHTVLHELGWEKVCDIDFLKNRTNSPYLIGPNGYYLRDPSTHKPLLWDAASGSAKTFDDKTIHNPALYGEFTVRKAVEIGPDKEVIEHSDVAGKTAFTKLVEHMKSCTPEWAGPICDVNPSTIRRLAKEFVDNAMVGATVTIDGVKMPLRPVAILLGKTVTNGWGAYQAVWARTVLQSLVGAIEVPGSILGVTIRLNRPMFDRLESVRIGEDGFMAQSLNPTDSERWEAVPRVRNAYKTLSPLVLDSSWSQALGPAHLPWLFMKHAPENWPAPTPPDVWMIYRTNPLISSWDPDLVAECLKDFPFIAAFAYTHDETNWFADVLLPDNVDLESYQLYRVGGTSYQEQFWEYTGVAIRQPVAQPPYNTMDLTDIATELADRTGLLREYNEAINNGVLGFRLKTPLYDYSLDPERKYRSYDIWDRLCKAATMSLSNGRHEYGLEWFRKNGAYLIPFKRINWYLHPIIVAKKLRYELPYQEKVMRVGQELGRRLHEHKITWWDKQLEEYKAMPEWDDSPKIFEDLPKVYGKKPEDYPFWLVTSRSMQYSWGANVSIPVIADISKHVMGHDAVMMNEEVGRRLGLKTGDEVFIESPIGRVRGRVLLRNGVRPDTVVALQQFGHWVTPVPKNIDAPNMNRLVPITLETTDGTGSGADLVKVRIEKVRR